jgi:8-oxo-dGTP diphosphatase
VASEDVVGAAGGVPWRRAGDGSLEVLVIHRPRYGDWTFPKGKLDPGETWEEAAVREVREETGLEVALGVELPSTEYRDRNGSPKRVRYWTLTVDADHGLPVGDEVDERRWVTPEQAAALLTYERDQAVLVRIVAIVSGTD